MIATVESVEPSLTIRSSRSRCVWDSTLSIACARYFSPLWTGMTTDTFIGDDLALPLVGDQLACHQFPVVVARSQELAVLALGDEAVFMQEQDPVAVGNRREPV